MFKNNKVNDIHKSRYIISWLKAGGHLYFVEEVNDFRDWLLSTGVTEKEAAEIVEMATCGKLELEKSAEAFLKEHY